MKFECFAVFFIGWFFTIVSQGQPRANTDHADFKHTNFKLVVINQLIKQGYYKNEIDSLKKNYWRWDDYSNNVVDEIWRFMQSLKIETDQLEDVLTVEMRSINC